jgi:hypothetical protein
MTVSLDAALLIFLSGGDKQKAPGLAPWGLSLGGL